MTMKSVQTGGVGAVDVVELERPAPGPNDVLLRVRACGICGTDATFLHMGGGPREDVTARLTELHGQDANALGQPRPGTDIYFDAAGAPAVLATTLASAKWHAKLVMVAVQKKAETDLSAMLRSELILIASMGYPSEIFEVTPQLAEHSERFARLISHRVPFSNVADAYALATTPGAAEKVIVTFDDVRR